MKKILLTILVGLLGGAAWADQATQIAQRYYALKKPGDTTALATMTLVDKAGNQKVRKLEILTKEGAEGTNSFLRFLEPADVSGTKFLMLTHRGSENEQRLYLPALKKTRKISSSSKDGEFVNSDFSYYDMEERFIEDNTYRLISGGEGLGDKEFVGMKFDVLELKPTSKSAPYARALAWVNQDNGFIYQMECYDRKDGALWKTIKVLRLLAQDGVLVPTKTVVKNHKKGTSTTLDLGDLRLNQGLTDDVFSVKKLEQ